MLFYKEQKCKGKRKPQKEMYEYSALWLLQWKQCPREREQTCAKTQPIVVAVLSPLLSCVSGGGDV